MLGITGFSLFCIYTAVVMVLSILAGTCAAFTHKHSSTGSAKQLRGQQIIVLGFVTGWGFLILSHAFLHPVKQILGHNGGDAVRRDNFPVAVFPNEFPVVQDMGNKV